MQVVFSRIEPFRGDKVALRRGIERIHFGQRGIGVLHYNTLPVFIIDLERRAFVRDGIARLAVHLDDLQIRSKRRVVDQVFVNFPVLADKNGKVRHELRALDAGDLFADIPPVREWFRLRKAIRITDKGVPFAFQGVLKAACRSEI